MKFLALSLLLLAAGPALAASPEVAGASPAEAERAATAGAEETWYRIEMDGSAVGWMSERRSQDEGRITTAAEISLGLNRAGTEVRVAIAGTFVESPEGEPYSFVLHRDLGGTTMVTSYRFDGEQVHATTVQGAREIVETIPLPAGEWLTPDRARREIERRHRTGAAGYTLRMLDPLSDLEPVTVTRERIIAPEDDPAAGQRQLWREEVSTAPGVVAMVETDASGNTLVSRTQLLGVAMTLTLTDRESALAGGGELGPELFLSNLIPAERAIPAGARRAVYELATRRGTIPELPSAGGQAAVRQGERVRVTVTPPSGDIGGGASDPKDVGPTAEERALLLAPSVFLDHQDPAVRAVLAEALGAGAEVDRDRVAGAEPGAQEAPTTVASRLTRFVHAYVRQKDLDTGLATASDVAVSRSGDCTEHSVLLAALLRGAGIPSRLVSGLAYLPDPATETGVFGYHMWVQAWTGDGWRDLDPTLPAGYDAGHIALGTATFSGSAAGPEVDRLLPLLGELEVRVLEVD